MRGSGTLGRTGPGSASMGKTGPMEERVRRFLTEVSSGNERLTQFFVRADCDARRSP